MPALHANAPGPTIRALSDELDRLAPRFDVEASQIKILRSPTEFYETLKVGRLPRDPPAALWLMNPTVKDTQGEEPDIPIDSVHWQDRA
jgi:hypothetical protein